MAEGKYGKIVSNKGKYGKIIKDLPDVTEEKPGIIQQAMERKATPTKLEQDLIKAGLFQDKTAGDALMRVWAKFGGEVGEMGEGLKNIPSILNELTQQKPGEVSAFGLSPTKTVEMAKQMGEGMAGDYGSLITDPVGSFKGRPLQSLLSILPLLKPAGKGLGAIKTGTGKLAKGATAKVGTKTLGVLTEDDIYKTLSDPKKYTSKPMSTNDWNWKASIIKDKAAKNLDDLTDFKVTTVEDSVAKRLGQFKENNISASTVKRAIDQSLVEKQRIIPGVKSEIAKISVKDIEEIHKLHKDIDALSVKNYNSLTGKYEDILKFDHAHALKKKIYKVIKSSYNKPDWSDDVGNAWKTGAKKINEQLRALSDDYAKANDDLSGIYKLNEEIGKGGFAGKFGKIGGSKRFRSMLNDPEGRTILEAIDKALPNDQRFMGEILGLEDLERIRKLWNTTAKREVTLPTAGVAAGLAAAGLPGTVIPGAAGIYAGLSLTNPPTAAFNLRLAEALSKKLGGAGQIPSKLGYKGLGF